MPAKAQRAAAPESIQTQDAQTLPMRYETRIHSIRPEGTCRATASVNINGCFAIRGIKVMESEKGLFISMPSYRAGNGEYKDICFPCTKEARAEFDSAVFEAYHQALTQGQSQGRHQQPAQVAAPQHAPNAPQMSM